MGERLTRLELGALMDTATWPHGLPFKWRPKTMPKLEAKGLVSLGRMPNNFGASWMLTETGRAALREQKDASHG